MQPSIAGLDSQSQKNSLNSVCHRCFVVAKITRGNISQLTDNENAFLQPAPSALQNGPHYFFSTTPARCVATFTTTWASFPALATTISYAVPAACGNEPDNSVSTGTATGSRHASGTQPLPDLTVMATDKPAPSTVNRRKWVEES
jgi:hypothetical protein